MVEFHHGVAVGNAHVLVLVWGGVSLGVHLRGDRSAFAELVVALEFVLELGFAVGPGAAVTGLAHAVETPLLGLLRLDWGFFWLGRTLSYWLHLLFLVELFL